MDSKKAVRRFEGNDGDMSGKAFDGSFLVVMTIWPHLYFVVFGAIFATGPQTVLNVP